MAKILICPVCRREHRLYLAKTGWFVCDPCQSLLKFEDGVWSSLGLDHSPMAREWEPYKIGQEGLLRNRPFRVVGCIQFCLVEDHDDVWFEWVLALKDGSVAFLVKDHDEPIRFFAERRPISHTVPDFSEVKMGETIQIENFYTDVFERYSSLVISFMGEIPLHLPPGSLEHYFDGYYGDYIAAVTYEDVPMICFGIELGADELSLFD